MNEKEVLKKLIAKIDEALEGDEVEKDVRAKNTSLDEEWSMKTYNFMKKYGHIS